MPSTSVTKRILGSPLVDLLLHPNGVDRYLELVRPDLTIRDARARVVSAERQTARSVTLTLRPNAAFEGFRCGQYLRVGVDIDGVRRTRTYSPASSEHRADGLLELTVTVHPNGLVSPHLVKTLRPGSVLHLGEAQGEFTLPRPLPDRLVLIGGGSGITPVLSQLRTLRDEGYDGEVTFVHYARTAADFLYRPQVEALAVGLPRTRVHYVATREGGSHVGQESFEALLGPEFASSCEVAVCGPPALIEAVEALWSESPERVRSETFTPPPIVVSDDAAEGTVSFARSERSAPIAAGTLLEQAEAAGLEPDFGCRMGICHTCTCRKRSGAVRNVRTGEVSAEQDEDIQLCISVPAGDVELDI